MNKRPYELFARFGADGKVQGAFARYITNVDDRDFEGEPIPLSQVASDPEFTSFAEQFSASAVSERDELKQRVTELEQSIYPKDVKIEQLESQVEQLQIELDLLRNPPGPDVTTIEGLKQYLAQVRYEKEVSGFTIGNQFISTNRDELAHWFARFFDAFNWLQGNTSTDPSGLYPYKPKGGSAVVMLTAAQAVRAYQCLAWYVNACIATEGQLIEAIDGGLDLTQAKAIIDNQGTWPQRQYDWEPS
jgi:hypothetical protein